MAKLTATELAALLAAIPAMPRSALLQHWARLFPKPPPKGLSTRLVAYAVAYQLQVNNLGGLSKTLAQRLVKTDSKKRKISKKPQQQSDQFNKPGNRLIREWHGKTYIVDVLDKGYRFQDRNYGSLSEIARTITGTRWSGPRFFAP